MQSDNIKRFITGPEVERLRSVIEQLERLRAVMRREEGFRPFPSVERDPK